ncbi:hypothetical protein [Streptomyces smaragdinus]|uniref:hypothetical protein n=1 Tax=Streptomyces smaragdinus TaxID=2585196 RepID=UPI001294D5CE|nr:hypothetical protein [Streptomyces smaragdinus]
MTPPTTALRPEPVLLTIGRRPPTDTATSSGLPVPIDISPIGEDEMVFIRDLDGESDGAGCSCSASDDQPY